MLPYQHGEISVDETFARFGSKSYAIAKINSVDVRSRRRRGDLGWIILGLISFTMLAAGIANQNTALLCYGATGGVIAFFMRRGARIIVHRLYLSTSNAEAQAFESENRALIVGMREAIEAAIAQK